MPSRKIHNLFAKAIFGDNMDDVNKFIDAPSKTLGPNHRVLFHSPKQLMAVAMLKKDSRYITGGMLHVGLDKIFSKNKNTRKLAKLLEAIK